MAEAWSYAGGGGPGEESETSMPLPAFARDPLGVLRRRWLWMLLCLTVCLAGVAAVVSTREPTYEAQTTILVSRQAIPEEFVRTTVVDDSFAHINAIVGQVLSRQNLATILQQYDLFSELRDEVPVATLIDIMRTHIEIYPQETVTRSSPGSQVFVIAYEHKNPEIAANVANELAGFFTAANIEMRNRQAQLTTDFLQRELVRSERELRDQERRITEFMQAHRGGLPGELDTNLAKLERLQAQRQSLATQIDAAESRLMLIKSQPDLGLDGPTPRSLLGDLRAQLEHQLVILTEEHPNVIALQRRIARLEADLEEEEAAPPAHTARGLQIAAEQRQLSSLREQQLAIEIAIDELDTHVEATPMRQEEFAALEQRATVLRENYLQFLRKVQEAQLAQSLESAQHGARISVLDRATPPSQQKHPRWKLMAAGIVAALGLSVLLAIVLELLDGVVVNASHLESLTDKPVLGSIPRVTA
jgi:succinoglycan biosynthesis transport protein ExoP